MAIVAKHLSVAELEERYKACEDVTSSRHFQTIYLATGHSTREVTEITSFGLRWVEQLLERYNAVGPAAPGDLCRSNGVKPTDLKPELLERLGARLREPPAGWGALDERRGRFLDGAGARAGKAGAPERLGSAEGAWVVDPKATAAQPEGGERRRAGGLQKKAPTSSPKRRKPIRAFPSNPLRQTSIDWA